MHNFRISLRGISLCHLMQNRQPYRSRSVARQPKITAARSRASAAGAALIAVAFVGKILAVARVEARLAAAKGTIGTRGDAQKHAEHEDELQRHGVPPRVREAFSAGAPLPWVAGSLVRSIGYTSNGFGNPEVSPRKLPTAAIEDGRSKNAACPRKVAAGGGRRGATDRCRALPAALFPLQVLRARAM
jgi:hypothetical protein